MEIDQATFPNRIDPLETEPECHRITLLCEFYSLPRELLTLPCHKGLAGDCDSVTRSLGPTSIPFLEWPSTRIGSVLTRCISHNFDPQDCTGTVYIYKVFLKWYREPF